MVVVTIVSCFLLQDRIAVDKERDEAKAILRIGLMMFSLLVQFFNKDINFYLHFTLV